MSSSIWAPEISEGSHHFTITKYSLLKGLNKPISSQVFDVGGCSWKIVFDPCGSKGKSKGYISVYLELVGGRTDPVATFSLFFQDQNGETREIAKETTKFDSENVESGSYSFMTQNQLGVSKFVKDDCVTIGCTIAVIQSHKSKPGRMEVKRGLITKILELFYL